MKILSNLLPLLLLATFSLHSQEELATESKPTEKPAPEKKEVVLQDKPVQAATTLEKRPITYSGFFVELSRAEDKKQLLSLRKPNDPQRDLKNLYRDERTNRPKGFVLFALDF